MAGHDSLNSTGGIFLSETRPGNWNVFKDALARTNLDCLFWLSVSAFISSAVDRLLQLKLGSISVFLSPTGDNLGAGVTYMVLPLALLLVPIALFFNNPARRLKYLETTMLIKALMAFCLSLDITREFLSQGGPRVGYSLSLIFLAGEWTVICVVLYLSQRASRPLIYLSALAGAYFLGQAMALVLAPYLVSQPFTNTFAALSGALYIVAYYAARRCQRYKFARPPSNYPTSGNYRHDNHEHTHGHSQLIHPEHEHTRGHSQVIHPEHEHAHGRSHLILANQEHLLGHPEHIEADHENFDHGDQLFDAGQQHSHTEGEPGASRHSSPYRLLAATTLLYTPLYVPIMLSLFYALQGYQTGTLTFAQLAANGTLAFSVGAFGSIFLHHLASRRRVLQIVALAAILLSSTGGLSYSYDISFFSLMAITVIAGFVIPDWENHLLSVLPPNILAPFFAARNTMVMVAIACLSPAVERTLSVVSALYVLKEFNLLVLITSIMAMLIAPLLLARHRQGKKLPLPESKLLTLSKVT